MDMGHDVGKQLSTIVLFVSRPVDLHRCVAGACQIRFPDAGDAPGFGSPLGAELGALPAHEVPALPRCRRHRQGCKISSCMMPPAPSAVPYQAERFVVLVSYVG